MLQKPHFTHSPHFTNRFKRIKMSETLKYTKVAKIALNIKDPSLRLSNLATYNMVKGIADKNVTAAHLRAFIAEYTSAHSKVLTELKSRLKSLENE